MPKFKQGALCVLIAAAFAGTAVAAPCNGPTGSAPTIVPDAPLTLTMALMQIRHASPDVRRAALETRASAAEAESPSELHPGAQGNGHQVRHGGDPRW